MIKGEIAKISVDLKKVFDDLKTQLTSLNKATEVTAYFMKKAFAQMKESVKDFAPKYSKAAFEQLGKEYLNLINDLDKYRQALKDSGMSSEKFNEVLARGSKEALGKYVERLRLYTEEYTKNNLALVGHTQKLEQAGDKILGKQKLKFKEIKAEEALTAFELIVQAADGSMEKVRQLMAEFPNDMKKAFLDKSGLTEQMRTYWATVLGVPTDQDLAKAKVQFKKLTDTKIRAMKVGIETTRLLYTETTGLKVAEPKVATEATRKFRKEEKIYTDGLANLERMKTELGDRSMARDKKEYDEKVKLIKIEEAALEKSLGRLVHLNKLADERYKKDIELTEKGKILNALGNTRLDTAKTLRNLRDSDSAAVQVEIDKTNNLIKLQKKLNDYNAKEQNISITLISSLESKKSLLLEELRIKQGLAKVNIFDSKAMKEFEAQFKVAANNVRQTMNTIGKLTIMRDIAKDEGDVERQKVIEAALARQNGILTARQGVVKAISAQENKTISLQDKAIQKNQRLYELGLEKTNLDGTSAKFQEIFIAQADREIKAAEILEEIEQRLLEIKKARATKKDTSVQAQTTILKEELSIQEKLEVIDKKLEARKIRRKKLTKEEKDQLKAIAKLKKELLAKEEKLAIFEGRRESALSKIHSKHKGIIKLMGQRVRFILTAGLAYKAQGAFVSMYKDSIKERLKLEREIAEVGTLQTEGLQASLAIMEKFKNAVIDLSERYGEDTGKLAKALYDIRSATIPTYKALGVLEAVTRAGKASLTDAATAAKPIIAILNAYKMEAEDAEKVSDMLFATIQRGVTTMKELGPNIGKAIAAAAMVGVDAPQVLAMVSSTTRMGVSTRETITAINRLMLNFSKQTTAATNIAMKYGFTLDSIRHSKTGLVELFNKMKDATDQEKIALVGSVRAFKAMAAGVIDAQGQMFDLEYIRNAEGKTAEAMEKIEQTIAFKSEQIKQKFHAAMIKFGDLIMPIFDKVLEGLDKLESSGMIRWFKTITQVITGALAIFAGFEILSGVGKLVMALTAQLKIFNMTAATTTALLGWLKGAAVIASIAFGIFMAHQAKLKFERLELEKLAKARKNRLRNDQLEALENVKASKEELKQLKKKIIAYKELEKQSKDSEAGQELLNKKYKDIIESSENAGISTDGYANKLDAMKGVAEEATKALESLSKVQIEIQINQLEEEIRKIEVLTKEDVLSGAMEQRMKSDEEGYRKLREMYHGSTGYKDFYKFGKYSFGDELVKETQRLWKEANEDVEVYKESLDAYVKGLLEDNQEVALKSTEIILKRIADSSATDEEFYDKIVETIQKKESELSKYITKHAGDIKASKEGTKEYLEITANIKTMGESNKILKDLVIEYTKRTGKEEVFNRLIKMLNEQGLIDESTSKIEEEDITATDRGKLIDDAIDTFAKNAEAKLRADRQKLQKQFIKDTDLLNFKGNIELDLEGIDISASDEELGEMLNAKFERIPGIKSPETLDLEKGQALEFLKIYRDNINLLQQELDLKIKKKAVDYDKKGYANIQKLTIENILVTRTLLESELATRKEIARLKGDLFDETVEQNIVDRAVLKLELQLRELELKKQIEEADRQMVTGIVLDDEVARVEFAKKRKELIDEIVKVQSKLNDLTAAETEELRMRLQEEHRLMFTKEQILILSEKINQKNIKDKLTAQQTTIANLRSTDKKEYLHKMSTEDIMTTLKTDKDMKKAGTLSKDAGLTKEEKQALKDELNIRSFYTALGIDAYQSAADIRVDIDNKANELINQGIQLVLDSRLTAIEKQKEADLKALEDRTDAHKKHVSGTILTAGHKAKVFAAIDKKTAEEKAKIEEEAEKKRQKTEKSNAKIGIIIDTARAIVSTFASLGFVLGLGPSLAMAAIGAAQLAIVNNASYAEGGYTGYGGQRDHTGKRQAGVVHEREFVFKESATDGNVPLFYAMQNALANGRTFASFATDFLTGSLKYGSLPSPTGSYADGGYATITSGFGYDNANLEYLMAKQNYIMSQMNERLTVIEYYNSETSDNTNKLRKQRNRY